MKIAAIADLHCKTSSAGKIRILLEDVDKHADVLVLAGDLTNIGLPREMEVLLKDLSHLRLPIVAVVGNHDHEGDQVATLMDMMREKGLHVLDCSSVEIDGVGFVGTKGFCGGFGERAVQPFGERALKAFVQSTINEAACLEGTLVTLKTTRKVAILHYAPISETLAGESPEIYPFLGSSLLAAALDHQRVDLILHGHAHNGSPMGHTAGRIPVYNVCRFVQNRYYGRSYSLFEI